MSAKNDKYWIICSSGILCWVSSKYLIIQSYLREYCIVSNNCNKTLFVLRFYANAFSPFLNYLETGITISDRLIEYQKHLSFPNIIDITADRDMCFIFIFKTLDKIFLRQDFFYLFLYFLFTRPQLICYTNLM